MRIRLIDKAWETINLLRKTKKRKALDSLNLLGYSVFLESGGFKEDYPHKKDKRHQAKQLFTSLLE